MRLIFAKINVRLQQKSMKFREVNKITMNILGFSFYVRIFISEQFYLLGYNAM
jgi:hypothetical protein